MSNSVSATVQIPMAGVDLSTADVTPTDTQTAATLAVAVAARLPITGGTLTGPLTLAADPATSLQAATKHYVDTSSAAGIPVTGATMTGPLLLSGNPTAALQAAPKQYVDTQVSTALPLSGGILSTISTGTSATSGNNVGTFDGFSNQFSFRRQITSGTPGQPTVYVGLTNFSNAYTSYYSTGEYIDVPAMIIQAQNVPGSTGQLNGLQILLNSGGNNPFDAEDQGLNIQVTKAGQNSTWAINTQSLDTTGLPPQAFATIGAEIDLGGSGYDTAASAYDPYQSNRATMWFNGRPYPWANWAASTKYPAGAVVVGTPPVPTGGTPVPCTYIAQNAGTSGTAPPTSWPTSGTVLDNGITWAYGTTVAFSIGRGIWFDSNLGANQFEWGTCISGDAIVQNAFLDTQRVSFADSTGAAIRLAPNQPIDFSGNLTQAGKNQHTLMYGSIYKQLVYAIGGQAALTVNDSFAIKTFGPTALASGTQGNLSGVTSGYSPQGLTVGWSYAGLGETDLMVDANGLNIYPVSAAGTTPVAPIFALNGSGNLKAYGSLTSGTSLTVGSTLSVAGVAGLAVTGSGSLHGVTAGFSPQGLTVGWSYANTGETDLMVSADGLNVYTVSAAGTASSTPIFALSGAGNLALAGNVAATGTLAGSTLSVAGVAGLAVTGTGSLHGVTSGFSPQGLTVGWSYANTGETDLMVSVDGLNVYTVSAAGIASSTPIFALSGAGNLALAGNVAATGTLTGSTLSVAGVAGLAVTGTGSLHGVTSGFSPQGLTVGWSYANTGETDLMVSVDGLSVYTVGANGVAASTPIFALSGAGNVTFTGNVSLPALKASASYANDAAAAAGGVVIGQLYRNGSNIQMRMS